MVSTAWEINPALYRIAGEGGMPTRESGWADGLEHRDITGILMSNGRISRSARGRRSTERTRFHCSRSRRRWDPEYQFWDSVPRQRLAISERILI